MTKHTPENCRCRLALGGLFATLGVALLTPPAAAGDDPLVTAARQLVGGLETRGIWRNPLRPLATGQEPSPSADEVLTAIVRSHTRINLDRGGWANPYVPVPGYDAGNALLAVSPGNGITSGS